ncbi:MAG TPA: hypothetical protein VHZ51_30290 [Ktedonobacteraceae bacterium]|nr:hypothetical protein [Ktedonobacteraceae bacterium]
MVQDARLDYRQRTPAEHTGSAHRQRTPTSTPAAHTGSAHRQRTPDTINRSLRQALLLTLLITLY